MKIHIIIHGATSADGTKKVSYLELDNGQIFSPETYIKKYGEDTYKFELEQAYKKRRLEESRWI